MWEYTMYWIIAENGFSSILNDFGKKGWELVSVIEGEDGHFWYYFKRPLDKMTYSKSVG